MRVVCIKNHVHEASADISDLVPNTLAVMGFPITKGNKGNLRKDEVGRIYIEFDEPVSLGFANGIELPFEDNTFHCRGIRLDVPLIESQWEIIGN